MSKTNMGIMRAVLLNPAFGFTKQRQDVPAPQVELGLGQDSHSSHLAWDLDSHENESENENESKNESKWGVHVGGTLHGVHTRGKPAIQLQFNCIRQ